MLHQYNCEKTNSTKGNSRCVRRHREQFQQVKTFNFTTRFNIVIMLLALSCTGLFAQQNEPLKKQYQMPEWVSYIDRSDVNFFEAVKLFDTYWEGKIRPEGDKDQAKMMPDKKADNRSAVNSMPLSTEEREFQNQLRYQYKRFEQWERESKPFVQPDGRILSKEERLLLWQQEKRNQSNK